MAGDRHAQFLQAYTLHALARISDHPEHDLPGTSGMAFAKPCITGACIHLSRNAGEFKDFLGARGEFVESSLGPAEEPGGGVTVRMIAEQYLFVPQCVVVPTGVPLRFRITSADVVHKLTISDAGDEVKAVPGYVVETHLRFERAGEYPMPCHEFCGPGHYAMRSKLIAVPPEQFRNLSRKARMNCVSR